MRGGSTPYVGLRATKTHPVGATLRASEQVRQARLARKDNASAWWVAYAYVMPAADFPSGADGYRDALRDALRAVWEAYGRAWPIGDESACVAHLMKLYQTKVSGIG